MKSTAIILAFLFITTIVACRKGDKSEQKSLADNEGLSQEDIIFLDTIGVPNWPIDSIIGYHRKSQSQRSTAEESNAQNLVKNMLETATSLAGRKNTLHQSEGPFKPEHYGIAYSYGQNNFEERLFPPNGNPLHRKYAIYGTDCSGLMVNLALMNNIEMSACDAAHFEEMLGKALKKNSLYHDIEIKNEGFLSYDDIINGDIIHWPKKRHIGIVALSPNGDNKVIFQSNGNPKPQDIKDQMKNWGTNRGVHQIDLKKAIHGTNYWGTGYEILRLKDVQIITVKTYYLYAKISVYMQYYGDSGHERFGYADYYITPHLLDQSSNEISNTKINLNVKYSQLQIEDLDLITPCKTDTILHLGMEVPTITLSATTPDNKFIQQTYKPAIPYFTWPPPNFIFGN